MSIQYKDAKIRHNTPSLITACNTGSWPETLYALYSTVLVWLFHGESAHEMLLLCADISIDRTTLNPPHCFNNYV